jgi:hypothetical protein
MVGITWRQSLMALAISVPLGAFVLAGRLANSEALEQATAFAVLVFGLPWVIPAFVVVAVASAPLFVALHIAGLPQELMPWLSGVILTAGVVACHVNATLLLGKILRKRARSSDSGLAEFLSRSPARVV